MHYAILFGRTPLLSALELEAVLGAFQNTGTITIYHKEIGFFDSEQDPKPLFDRLGGSIKIGVQIGTYPTKRFTADPLAVLSGEPFLDAVFGENTSIAFAFSLYGDIPQGFQRNMKRLSLSWKKFLKDRFSHVRYVESKEPTTSSVTVKRNKLLSGFDCWLIFDEDKVHVIKTIGVQEYRDFSERDYGRPARDSRAGMLPPKLARMMVNIAGATSQAVVLDPFVGSGTVLQEASLLGVKKLYGSDISKYAAEATRTNLEWLHQQAKITVPYAVTAKAIEELDPGAYQDVTHIVAEIDLGDPLKGRAREQSAHRYAKDASVLYEAALRFASELPRLESVVLALPFWPTDQGHIFCPRSDFKEFQNAHDVTQYQDVFGDDISPYGGILYKREKQFVGREIIVLGKNF